MSDYVKDTILKANHNPKSLADSLTLGVSDYVKDTILKANHNQNGIVNFETKVCQTMSKIQF